MRMPIVAAAIPYAVCRATSRELVRLGVRIASCLLGAAPIVAAREARDAGRGEGESSLCGVAHYLTMSALSSESFAFFEVVEKASQKPIRY